MPWMSGITSLTSMTRMTGMSRMTRVTEMNRLTRMIWMCGIGSTRMTWLFAYNSVNYISFKWQAQEIKSWNVFL